MKIVISNIVTLNVGDAAILRGMLRILERTYSGDLDIIVFDKNGADAAGYYPWATFRQSLFLRPPRTAWQRWLTSHGRAHVSKRIDYLRFRLAARLQGAGWGGLAGLFATRAEREDLEAYRTADLVVSSGGTYLVENYGLLSRILDYELTLELGRPLAFFTQSLGPFSDPRFTPRLLRIFRAADAICLRDEASRGHLEELGVMGDKVGVFADAAFALARSETARRGSDSPLRVALSVREWKHFKTVDPAVGQDAYFDAVARLVEHLVHAHDAHITFASTCQGMPEYWTDDADTATEIAARVDLEAVGRVMVDREARGPDELIDFYAGFDFVMATRMHSAILALCAGTPVLPVAYEFKTKELFRRLNLERWVTDIEDIDGDEFCALVDEFLANLEDVRRAISAGVPTERDSAFEPSTLLHGVPGGDKK